jgi:integrase
MPKLKTEVKLLPLLHTYQSEMKRGKHLQKNGKRLRPSSIENYANLHINLMKFCNKENFLLRACPLRNASKSVIEREQKYWKHFYLKFTDFLYQDRNNYDNHVGRTIKLLRCFFSYLNSEKGLNIGSFHAKFYAPSEEVEILALTPERLNILIHTKDKDHLLSETLKQTKDIFIFGCTVALRFSDLMLLKKDNIELVGDRTYLKVRSKKTQTYTRVKLPDYVVSIIDKYSGKYSKRIIPHFNLNTMNLNIKLLLETYGFIEEFPKYRQKRGVPILIYKNSDQKAMYRFCDLATTHTMRRTAITTMLCLGMSEQVVRKISGHSANSKEFYRYVAFAQTYIDKEINMFHDKLQDLNK